MITRAEMNNLADMAKFSLDEEIGELQMEISEVLEFVSKIKDVDTEGVDPTEQLETGNHPLREDVVGESLSHEDVVANTKEDQYGYFKILNIMD
ncbi:MAG: Asp-tRNA(Asn)/Glu-tRNA(Gln) amidotransferase subunit GatC [Tissierellia bacterium]|jgi:aspartyl-tRNA(Asn)/glutamyl-tRNA(Gln) amidotransferase subunit C|nr:Asp-tRNA(Asn)/Glu-tRNA(Gln) amidotransferase subunit GatC [Tissierellia bacterium]